MRNDVMLSFNNDNMSVNFINNLSTIIPKGYATMPTNPKVSDRYRMASTADVVADMAKLGWLPVAARQTRGNNAVRSFHMVAFQNPNVKITKKLEDGTVVDDCFPRIIMTNSHDGFNSFKFMIGIYRLVCSNGLVVSSAQFASLRITHINYSFEELRQTVNHIVSIVPDQVKVMNDMERLQLTDTQKRSLAVAAIRIRKDNPELEVADEDIDELLDPTRREDEGNSLWTVFNLLQEKMIKGNFYMRNSKGKTRKARKITAIKKDLSFNQAFFEEAVQYLP